MCLQAILRCDSVATVTTCEGTSSAINWLSEFPLPEAIRLAKKLSFQAKIPSWAVPGLNQTTTTMSQSEFKNLRVVKNPETGSHSALVLMVSRMQSKTILWTRKSAQQVDGHRNSLAPRLLVETDKENDPESDEEGSDEEETDEAQSDEAESDEENSEWSYENEKRRPHRH
ncbi:hypothetical protein GCK72_022087 [Caenorhabditis remanei]|uniref:Uncharacterized protein n=1 Tax=Caenorhabditis remanei TaxID=31234 RepID=A0A6A5FST3_CAERE|nr:hypothetical protein GCK72_022087 [Caenorhabditis remanei]KAF1745640.1 hypothetical protein GCK72_022087 [Caenorhabditis remanei]